MNPFEFIDFKKDDLILKCTNENGFSESQAHDIFGFIVSYIERLKNCRHSEKLTKKVVNELIEFTTHPIGKDWNDAKFNLIIHWLLKAIWEDRSYYWAKIFLGRYYNREMALLVYDVVGELMTDKELYDILKTDNIPENIKNQADADKLPDYSDLLESLKKYIDGISAPEFSKIIKYHSLTPDTPKAKWIGNRADAHRFAAQFKMSIPDWNNCFQLKNGQKLKHNDRNDSDSAITKIFQQYFSK